jgi:phosphoglycerate dehydrogenase-like enzyme
MEMIEQKNKAIFIVKEILENRMMNPNRDQVAEHIIDALMAFGWRGPKELRWIQEKVWDQAKAGGEKNPFREEK